MNSAWEYFCINWYLRALMYLGSSEIQPSLVFRYKVKPTVNSLHYLIDSRYYSWIFSNTQDICVEMSWVSIKSSLTEQSKPIKLTSCLIIKCNHDQLRTVEFSGAVWSVDWFRILTTFSLISCCSLNGSISLDTLFNSRLVLSDISFDSITLWNGVFGLS